MNNNSFEKQHLYFSSFFSLDKFLTPTFEVPNPIQTGIFQVQLLLQSCWLTLSGIWKWAPEGSALQCGKIVVLIDKCRTGTQMTDMVMPWFLGKVQKNTPHKGVEDLFNDKSNWNMFLFDIPEFLTLILEVSLTCSLLRTNGTSWNAVLLSSSV